MGRRTGAKGLNKTTGVGKKELGDGVLPSFTTVSDAVNTAIKIQEACNLSKKFLLRIGIHHGEVVVEDDNIFGDLLHSSPFFRRSSASLLCCLNGTAAEIA